MIDRDSFYDHHIFVFVFVRVLDLVLVLLIGCVCMDNLLYARGW